VACFHPITGFKDRHTGGLTFNPKMAYVDLKMTVSCGQCIGCRLERSRQWAVRCMHEASQHSENSFLTLTYRDLSLPEGGTLVKRDFQNFMKRLRKKYSGRKVRFFHCGEYGDSLGRPHYHALLFGLDFEDKLLHKKSNSGDDIFTSKILDSVWQLGHAYIGSVTFESAAYVARYCLKKRTGHSADEHYEFIDPDTGEVFNRQPEYITMSLKPGIGAGWFDNFKSDVFPNDEVIVNGLKVKPPRYYVRRLSEPELILLRKKRLGTFNRADQTPERLIAREAVAVAKNGLFKRS